MSIQKGSQKMDKYCSKVRHKKNKKKRKKNLKRRKIVYLKVFKGLVKLSKRNYHLDYQTIKQKIKMEIIILNKFQIKIIVKRKNCFYKNKMRQKKTAKA